MLGKKNDTVLYNGFKKRQEQLRTSDSNMKVSSKIAFRGTCTVFVTSLKHGVGCSYFASVIANFLWTKKKEKTSLIQTNGISDKNELPDEIDITIYPCNLDRIYASNYAFVVRDGGIYKDLEEEETKELLRADVKVMMCWPDDEYLKMLASFIQTQDFLSNWYFVFNMVPDSKKRFIDSIMEDYQYICLPCVEIKSPTKEVCRYLCNIFGKR